ncbi:MAG: condensation domain-containing protein, partial [Planctomycetota bacterium]
MQPDPQCCAYNNAIAVQLDGPLDAAELEQALNLVLERHEILRSRVVEDDRGCFLDPSSDLSGVLAHEDWRSLTEGEQDEDLKLRVEKLVSQPFTLVEGPLIRAHLLALGDQRQVFVLEAHQLLCDRESLSMIFSEVSECYRASIESREPVWCTTPSSVDEFVRWNENRPESGEDGDRFWRDSLGSASGPLELPSSLERPSSFDHSGDSISLELAPGLNQSLVGLARSERVTKDILLLGLFKLALARYSGQAAVTVGTIGRGVGEPGDGRIGCYADIFALQTRVGGMTGLRQLLSEVKSTYKEALQHASTPFERVVEVLSLDPDPSRMAVFQAMYLPDDQPSNFDFGTLASTPLSIFARAAKTDLTLVANGSGLFLQYSTAVLDRRSAERFASYLSNLLGLAVTHASRPLREITRIGASEQEMQGKWNETSRPYPLDGTLHSWINRKAAECPDRTALIYEGEAMSYEELNQRSNQLARYLNELGIRGGSLVGISLERSFELVIGLLGILKAGAAYVPMDPEYPRDRLSYMLGDSDVPVLLTQERLLESLPEHRAKTVCLDRDWAEVAKCPR